MRLEIEKKEVANMPKAKGLWQKKYDNDAKALAWRRKDIVKRVKKLLRKRGSRI